MKLEVLISMLKHNSKKKMRGQSEVIGGVIVLTALIISMGLIFANLGKLSSSSVTGISMRAAFETEKSFEKIQATRTSTECRIKNTGNTPVTIVRAWRDSQPVELDKVTLNPGETQSIDLVDFIVTSRGNVFSCTIQEQTININATGPFTSEQVLNNVRLRYGFENGYVYAIVNNRNYSVVYNYTNKLTGESRWYCSLNSTDKGPVNRVININPDYNNNTINEVIIVSRNDKDKDKTPITCREINGTSSITEYGGISNTAVTVIFVFKDLVNVTSSDVDTITVYFKAVLGISVSSGGNPHDVFVLPTIVLELGGVSLSSPSTTTVGASTTRIEVFGSAVFPIRAFGTTVNEGLYTLKLQLDINLPTSSVTLNRVRLEYLAVVGNNVVLNYPWETD